MNQVETEPNYIFEVEDLVEEPINSIPAVRDYGALEIVICIAILLRAIATVINAFASITKTSNKED